MDEKKLLELASEARQNSYSPYSKFRVGAALLTKSGKIFTGCNIENATYGATCCAERTAIYKAISEGEKEFDAIAVQGDNEGLTFPCGICRQVISEFAPDIQVVLGDHKGNVKKFSLSELLPHAFYKENLNVSE
ncbi:cytidine deaminase [Petroclostridium sp. X23]|uniref:cytidine deaminase n=1 Tax=Petroclostridium sp. X23 TaxID=3045146 RepID=UPI0024ACAD49|nr:cytidine deaminase [Petroclostridium sp. X23]WHH59575.1 cytidine deaminase [Petroclostridium sp. X23]